MRLISIHLPKTEVATFQLISIHPNSLPL